MRLINVKTCQFEFFEGSNVPRYAILSHTWGQSEVLYADIVNATNDGSRLDRSALPQRAQDGFSKIELSCNQAEKDGLGYVWIDTCCIDKSSSAELSESINSMFRFYREAHVCYVFLSDYSASTSPETDLSGIESCRWFTRGWTLQELLAPEDVQFYDREWIFLGSKSGMCSRLSKITGIQEDILRDAALIDTKSIAQRMSWMTNADGRCRQTTRAEDLAYCLIGILGINMPLLYGEGSRSFARLQDEVLKETDDESIFAWTDEEASPDAWHGLFATHPKYFKLCGNVVSFTDWKNLPAARTTSSGLSINLALEPNSQRADLFLANINCRLDPSKNKEHSLAIYLHKIAGEGSNYTRVIASTLDNIARSNDFRQVNVRQQPVTPKAGDLNLDNSFRVDLGSDAMNRYNPKHVIYKTDNNQIMLQRPDTNKIYSLRTERSLSAAFFFEDRKDAKLQFWVLLGCGKTPGCVSHNIVYTMYAPKTSGGAPYLSFIKALNNGGATSRWDHAKIYRALERHFEHNLADEQIQLRDGRYFDTRYHLEAGKTDSNNLVVRLVMTG